MNQGRNRRGTGHRVGQPNVKRNLRRLASRADEQKQPGPERHRLPKPQGCAEGCTALGGIENLRNAQRAGGAKEQEHSDEEAEITDAVGDEGLLAGTGVGAVLVPEANQEVAGQPHAFPTDEYHGQVVAQDQEQHRPTEQIQVREEAWVVLLVGHVAHRIDVDERADEGDHQAQKPRQGIHAQRKIHHHLAAGKPRIEGVDNAASMDDRRQPEEEGIQRDHARGEHRQRGDRVHHFVRVAASEQHEIRRPEQRHKGDESQLREHGQFLSSSMAARSIFLRTR